MSKRLFVGLPVPENLQKAIEGWRRGFSDLPVRWLSGSNLHITLVPPSQGVPDEAVSKLQNAQDSHAPINVRFMKISFGTDPNHPRLIWAEGEYDPRLRDLRDDLNMSLGNQPEERRLFPHITLARFSSENFSQFPIKTLSEEINWTARFETFALYESILRPEGAEYQIIKEFKI